MRIVVSILLLILTLFTSNSWHVDIHFCHDEVMNVSFNHDAANCGDSDEATCGNCCEDAHIEFTGEQDYISADYFVNVPFDLHSQINSFNYISHPLNSNTSVVLAGSNSSPPPRKLFIQHCSLVLYG